MDEEKKPITERIAETVKSIVVSTAETAMKTLRPSESGPDVQVAPNPPYLPEATDASAMPLLVVQEAQAHERALKRATTTVGSTKKPGARRAKKAAKTSAKPPKKARKKSVKRPAPKNSKKRTAKAPAKKARKAKRR